MGETYPKGPWRPLGAATRNTMTFANDPGDPTAIGIPVPGAPHKPISSMKVPPIPEAPITGEVARRLLSAMGGPVGASTWHPGFAFPLHLGGDVRAHFVLKTRRFFGPMWDVIGTLPGKSDAQMVVVGGHRDAWTYGAVDPISGTVDLLQLARAFGKLKAAAGGRSERSSSARGTARNLTFSAATNGSNKMRPSCERSASPTSIPTRSPLVRNSTRTRRRI